MTNLFKYCSYYFKYSNHENVSYFIFISISF